MVKLIFNGQEQEPGDEALVLSNNYLEIPLRSGDYYVQHAWPGGPGW